MFIHTCISGSKRFAKFGCHKKMERAVAKLESDRL